MKDVNINLIIFDMDGVLVEGCEWHRIALDDALYEVCGYKIPIEEHYSEYNGLPTKVKLQKLSEKGIIESSKIEYIENLKQRKTVSAILENANIRQEKIELMEYLKNNKLKIACFTNSIRYNAELMLEKTGIINYFDLLITNQEVKKPKPDPEGYLMCLEKLGVDPKNAVIVEDSPKGLEAARKSGAHVIAVKDQEEVTIDLFKGIIK